MIFGILFVLVVLLGGLLIYLGALYPIRVETGVKGPFRVVFQPLRGNYRQVGDVAEALAPRLAAAGIPADRQTFIGIYYDDPRKVEEAQLRSEAGFIVPETVGDLPAELAGEYHIKTIPATEYAFAYFPYRNMLSIFMGIFRVYPKLTVAVRERGVEQTYGIEIYRPAGEDKLLYLIPVEPTETYLDR